MEDITMLSKKERKCLRQIGRGKNCYWMRYTAIKLTKRGLVQAETEKKRSFKINDFGRQVIEILNRGKMP